MQMKSISFFLVFLFGIMAGYAWQHKHNAQFRDEVKSNRILIADLNERISNFIEEISIRQQAINIILCESSMQHNGIYSDGGKSFGWAQFQKKTFREMSFEAGYQNLKYENPFHQLVLLEWAIKNGIAEKHWKKCWQKINS